MKIIPIKGWVIVGARGRMIWSLFNPEQKIAIRRIEKRTYHNWKELANRGYRCIQVTLTEDNI